MDDAERLRDVLRDIHDDLQATYPWAYTLERTTIADFQKAGDEIDKKIMAALYPDQSSQERGSVTNEPDADANG